MIEVNLRYVHECSFVRGEHTNYDLWLKYLKRKKWTPLKEGQAVAFVSKQRNQIVFVYKPVNVKTPGNKESRVTVSTRVRLHSLSTLTPEVLQEAAVSANIKLVNFKHFSNYFKDE